MFTFARVEMRVSWFLLLILISRWYHTEKALHKFGGKFKSTYLPQNQNNHPKYFLHFPWIQKKITNHNKMMTDKAEIRNSSRMCLWILLVLLMHMWAAACMYGVINSQNVFNKICMGSIIYFIEGRSPSRLVYVKFGGNPW